MRMRIQSPILMRKWSNLVVATLTRAWLWIQYPSYHQMWQWKQHQDCNKPSVSWLDQNTMKYIDISWGKKPQLALSKSSTLWPHSNLLIFLPNHLGKQKLREEGTHSNLKNLNAKHHEDRYKSNKASIQPSTNKRLSYINSIRTWSLIYGQHKPQKDNKNTQHDRYYAWSWHPTSQSNHSMLYQLE